MKQISTIGLEARSRPRVLCSQGISVNEFASGDGDTSLESMIGTGWGTDVYSDFFL